MTKSRRCLATFLPTLVVISIAAVATIAGPAPPAGATDLYGSLMSPNFGGTNGIALQMAQQAKGLQASQASAKAAAITAAAKATNAASGATVNQDFINSIVSQLTGLVAYKIAYSIANSTPGQAGTIQSNGATITYINQDGQLNLTVTSATGTTTLSVPTGN
jgi:hypothetical protein